MLKFALGFVAVGFLAVGASAATPELPPLPTPAVTTPAVTAVATPATPATPLVPVPDLPGTPTPTLSAEPIYLFTDVTYQDLDNVPKGAVPTIIAIPDRRMPGCVRYIEICVLPDCKPRIHTSPSGRKIEYDFGSFEVEIYNRTNYVVVNYDD